MIMEKTYTIQSIKSRPDILKGQKIVAALYLVTDHLPDTDPIKNAIRSYAVTLVTNSISNITEITTLLGAAVLAQRINEKNVAILIREIGLYRALIDTRAEGEIDNFFTPEQKTLQPIKKTGYTSSMSFISQDMSFKPRKSFENNDNKNKRQIQILDFINDRKSVSIKDISALFTDVSEKTIQRELGLLVTTGKITKRGSKRWSIYMALPV
jgi:hypothetical protein